MHPAQDSPYPPRRRKKQKQKLEGIEQHDAHPSTTQPLRAEDISIRESSHDAQVPEKRRKIVRRLPVPNTACQAMHLP